MESTYRRTLYTQQVPTSSSDFCATKKFLTWGIRHEMDSSVFGIPVCVFGNIIASGIDFLGNTSLAVFTTGDLLLYPVYMIWREATIERDEKAYRISLHFYRVFASIPQATVGTFAVMFFGLQSGLDFANKIDLCDPSRPDFRRPKSTKHMTLKEREEEYQLQLESATKELEYSQRNLRDCMNGRVTETCGKLNLPTVKELQKSAKLLDKEMRNAREFVKAHPEYAERHRWNG